MPKFVRGSAGVALVTVILLGLILSAISLALILRSSSDQKSVSRSRSNIQSRYAVESGIGRARARIAASLRSTAALGNFRPSDLGLTPSTAQAAGDETAFTPAAGAGVPYYRFPVDDDNDPTTAPRLVRYTIQADDGTSSFGAQNCPGGFTTNWCTGNATQGVFRSYIITSALDDPGNKPFHALQSRITVNRSGVFRNFATYDDHMEVFPGGGFTIRGKLHSNKSIFLGNGINFRHLRDITDTNFDNRDSDITAVGQVYRNRLHNSTAESDVNVYVRNKRANGTYEYVSRTLGGNTDSVKVGATLAAGTGKTLTDPTATAGRAQIGDNAYRDGSPNTNGTPHDDKWVKDTTSSVTATINGTSKTLTGWDDISKNYFDDRVRTGDNGVTRYDLPEAASLDPGSSNNRFKADADTKGLVVQTVGDSASTSSFSGTATTKLSENDTVIWKEGTPIAIVSADGLKEWTPVPGTDPKDISAITKGSLRGSGATDGSEDCNDPSKRPGFAGFTPPASALTATATDRKFPKCTFHTSSFKDTRENKTVKVTNIDVGRLGKSGLPPATGPVYATRLDAAPGTSDSTAQKPNGIRLMNGSTLPQESITSDTTAPACTSNTSLKCKNTQSFTVVTNNPSYVQGDYNKQHVDATGKTPGQVGYNVYTDLWRPSSIISDATTILSNAWKDSENGSGNGKNAASTTVNAVIATGTVPSKGSTYSGGLENFVRLLENWNNDSCRSNTTFVAPGGVCTLTFKGAMVQLWQSRYGTSAWGRADYSAPQLRDWSYDLALQDKPDDVFGLVGVQTNVGGDGRYEERALDIGQYRGLNLMPTTSPTTATSLPTN
jgi:hypothetical protein